MNPEVEILLPVHNEADSIRKTISEICSAVMPLASARFVVCEDGSSDGSGDELAKMTKDFPMQLFTSHERKGYSRAVIDGFRKVEAPYVLFLDSDGQIDPKAFSEAYALREQYDVIIGWRVQRADPLYRRIMSWTFRAIYKPLTGIRLKDPSCPFLLIRKSVIQRVVDKLGTLEEGFWWEFMAWVCAYGFRVAEVPVTHRSRLSGPTRVYSPRKVPSIMWRHLVGLVLIWRRLRTVAGQSPA